MTGWNSSDEAGERRQLTVMFCDLVGSTSLGQRHDPEVVRSVLLGYRRVVDDAVSEVEGTIARWVGDGALVYFGHPVAHEDDAYRAVHAGLTLLERLAPVAADAKARRGIELAVRIAVDTGLVVRAEMGTPNAPDADAIIGNTPNLAARLQDVARPGTMLISAATRALVSKRFDAVPVGPFELKGIEGPVEAYEVVSELPETSAAESLEDAPIFLGRHHELDLLLTTWEEVEGGGGSAVLIQGDPGIGKTRLSAELRRRALDRGGQALLGFCSPFHQSTPLFPLRRVLETAAAVPAGSSAVATLERVRPSLQTLRQPEAVAIVAELLGVDSASRPAVELDPQRHREVTFDVLLDWIGAAAAEHPLLLLLDDVQWAAPTTVELVGRIIDRRPPNVMLVMTTRSGHPIPWPRSKLTVLELGPLREQDVRALIASLGAPLAEDVVSSVVHRADGVPLYVEELVRHSATVGTRDGSDLPTSLRDPLLSRLSAAGEHVGLAQLVATAGDDVDASFLAAVTGEDVRDVSARLAALSRTGLMDHDELAGTYRFHHQLMAELTYETQLLSVRQSRHLAIAEALERSSDRDDATLGRHYEQAGRPEAAIPAYVASARAAQRRGSHPEAMTLLDHAMELAPAVPDTAARAELELLVLECRGFTRTSVLGLASPDAADDYGRCLELIRAAPDGQLDARVLTSAYYYFAMHGDLAIAEELATRQGGPAADAEYDLTVITGTAFLAFLRGDFHTCIAESERFLASDHGRLDAPVPEDYPVANEPVASTLGALAATLAFTGDVAGAAAATERLRDRVARLPFPYGPHSAASGLGMACLGWWNLRDEARFRATSAEIRDIAGRHGMVAYEVLTGLQDALAECRFGGPGAASHAAMMVELWKATGVLVFVSAFGVGVAEALLREGDTLGARTAAEANLALGAEIGVTFADPLLLRVRGAARLEAGDEDGFDELRRAADLAARQGAALFELQARLELAQRTQDPTSGDELRRLVDGFPADRSFPDLDRARELLEGS